MRRCRSTQVDDSGQIDFEEFRVALFACDPNNGNPIGFAPNALLTPIDAFEMFDEDGNMLHDELIYIRPDTMYWTEFEDEDDE